MLVRADQGLLAHQQITLDDVGDRQLVLEGIGPYELGGPPRGFLRARWVLEDRNGHEIPVVGGEQIVTVETGNLLQGRDELLLHPLLEAGERPSGRSGS